MSRPGLLDSLSERDSHIQTGVIRRGAVILAEIPVYLLMFVYILASDEPETQNDDEVLWPVLLGRMLKHYDARLIRVVM